MKKSRAYQPDLSESLRAREAEVYLNGALEEDDLGAASMNWRRLSSRSVVALFAIVWTAGLFW